jgi:hypothetical protein
VAKKTILSTEHDKRRRRTKAEIETLREMMFRILERDHPQSVRHVFYRMTDPRLDCAVEKTESGYRHVQYQLSEMRKCGLLPYNWIVDSTRRGYFVTTFTSASDFIRSVAGLYRADAWRNAEVYVEIWCESRSIAAVVQDDCKELGISLYPSGGFASLTLLYEAAKQIAAEVEGADKAIEIIYIGDYDPAGVLIDRDIEAKLRQHLANDEVENPLTFRRLAITEAQIARYDLPTKPRKTGDRRALHVHQTVEAEALPAGVLRSLLREEVESFLPARALAIAKVAEESERAGLLKLARNLEAGRWRL